VPSAKIPFKYMVACFSGILHYIVFGVTISLEKLFKRVKKSNIHLRTFNLGFRVGAKLRC